MQISFENAYARLLNGFKEGRETHGNSHEMMTDADKKEHLVDIPHDNSQVSLKRDRPP